MRLLHTADLHLGGDERTLDALEALLDEAARLDVDALTVGGDLFDSPSDADRLRPTLREAFADNPFDVIAVPGNHDADAFAGNVEFGPDFTPLTTDPYETEPVGDGRVVGVPYADELGEDRYLALRERAVNADEVLLVHCTLDVAFDAGAVGDEARTQYCPVQKETLGELGYEFVLAGHIHSDLYQTKLSNGGLFIYPGSPTSHATSETGRRHAVLVDTDDSNVRPIQLGTPYYDQLSATITPGEAEDVIDRVENWVDGHDPELADLTVDVDGYTELDESTVDRRLREAAGPATVVNETRGVADVLDHPIYADFVERLEETDLSQWEGVEDETQVERRLVETLAHLLANDEVSHV